MKTPVGWSIKSLDELIELDVETLSATTPRDFSFYYLDISAASQGRLSIPAVTTDFFEAPSRARKVVRRGDVLMSMVRPNLKAFALFDQTLQPCVASTGFAVLRSKSETSAAFILYSILSEDVSNQIDGLVTGSNYPVINSTAVRALKILTPPKDEQSNIAEVLSTVDQAIEQTEALIAKQKRIKTGLMQDLLTRGIDEHGQLRTEATHAFKDSPLGRIPVEWEVARLGEVAEISAGITLGKLHEGPDTEELPYLRVANVQDGYLDLTEVKSIRVPKSHIEKYTLKDGDVLMNEGGDFDKLGRGAVWRNQLDTCLHQNHVFKVRPQPEKLASDYLAAVSASPYGKTFFMMASKQSTNLASINSTQLKAFPIPMPSYKEQLRIQSQFGAFSEVLNGSALELKKHSSLKTALMQDLLTGRKRVHSLIPNEVYSS